MHGFHVKLLSARLKLTLPALQKVPSFEVHEKYARRLESGYTVVLVLVSYSAIFLGEKCTHHFALGVGV